jgi:hypothetical protein
VAHESGVLFGNSALVFVHRVIVLVQRLAEMAAAIAFRYKIKKVGGCRLQWQPSKPLYPGMAMGVGGKPARV